MEQPSETKKIRNYERLRTPDAPLPRKNPTVLLFPPRTTLSFKDINNNNKGHQRMTVRMIKPSIILFLLCALLWPFASLAFSVNRVFVSTPSQTKQRLVADCMTAKPVCLKTTDSVDEAIQKLLSLGFNGAPVIDPTSHNLVGMISAFDFLQKEEGGTLLPLVQDGNPHEFQQTANAARKICAQTVGDLMTPHPATVVATTTMKEASERMLRENCHKMCVVDHEGTLIGLLSTSDVMKHVLKVAQQALPEGGTESINGNSRLKP